MKEDFPKASIQTSSISMLISSARRQVKFCVAEIGRPYGMNPYQAWMVLLLREHGSMSLSELAGRMWMDHPTTSRLVHALELEGLLRVQPDPSHGRKIQIEIAPEKSQLADEIYEKTTNYRTRLEEGMTPEEKAHLRSGLGKVILNLGALLQEMKKERPKGRRPSKSKTPVG